MNDPGGWRVAVVGGGITGLAAAHRLTTRGVDVVLVEKADRLGGKVQTETVDGFLVEGGPDSFVSAKQHVLDLASELGIAGEVISSLPANRGSLVYSRGRLHPLPEGLLLMAPSRLGPVLSSPLLSWRGRLRVVGDLVAPRRKVGGDESLESFVVRRLGREVLERIAQPLVAGIHAAEPATMSLAASFPRFLDMEREHRSLILAAKRAAARPPARGTSYFASFSGGMGTLIAALLRAIEAAEIHTGSEVETLTQGAHGYLLRLADGRQVVANSVVLATPASEAARLLEALAPSAAAAVSEIRQVSSAVVTLGYRTADLPQLDGYGFVVPSVERRHITGATYLTQKWEGRSSGPAMSLVRAFIGGADGQELALADEDRLVATARAELEALAGIAATPVMVRTRTWEGGLHQYTLGHLQRVARAEAALVQLPGILLAGAAFHGIGLNECVRSGQHAAARPFLRQRR